MNAAGLAFTHRIDTIPGRPEAGAKLTQQAIPGVLEYEGARIQLLDLPGIVQDAAKGALPLLPPALGPGWEPRCSGSPRTFGVLFGCCCIVCS